VSGFEAEVKIAAGMSLVPHVARGLVKAGTANVEMGALFGA